MTDPSLAYRERVQRCDARLDELRGRSARLTTVRVATFLAAAAGYLVWDVASGTVARAGGVAALFLVVAFLFEVAAHRRVRAEIRWRETLRGLAEEGLLRLDRAWKALADALPLSEREVEPAPPDHPYARDLDVLGDASLFRLAGPVTSERGRERLRAWLLSPSPPDEVGRRRGAVEALASQLELRMDFAAHGRLHGAEDPPGTGRFLEWAEGAPWILERRVIRALAWVLPVLLVGLLVADLGFGAPPYWILAALGNAEVLRRTFPTLHAGFLKAEDGLSLLPAYVPQLRTLEDASFADKLLTDLRRRVGEGDAAASARLARLARLLATVESRRNVVYVTLSLFLLLDVHLAAALDRWRLASGPAVRDWLEALGEWEALSALASLAHDHPSWTFAHPTEGPDPILRGEGVGHPLLPPEGCVTNDVEVGPPGSFLLVTGSNMSGKSTLLRAVGANVVLASAGAPVCARALTLPPLRIRTSMRVDDDLAQGVSLFMAELLRIRGIVEDAHPRGAGGDAPVLYLLDEILHGTNTAERRVAARAVIRHLLARNALGAVSTHDLTLAQAPDLEAAARPVHFRESVERREGRTHLTFDYRLRPGLATTRNALKLLDAVGLGGLVEEGEAAEE